jgi:coenzyme F420 hydrogenase subunit beta
MLQFKRLQLPERPTWQISYFQMLKERVIDSGLCSNCYACSALCPAGMSTEDKVELKGKCKDCGACIRACHRWDSKPLSGLGKYLEVIASRSKRFKGQDGGMVTEIIASAFEMGLIDKAVVVSRDESWKPKAVIVSGVEELKDPKIAGSKYSIADVLPTTTKALFLCNRGVAVVGTPCIVSGVRKLQSFDALFKERVKIVIGLFCTENFHYDSFAEFLRSKGIKLEEIKRMSIKRGKLKIENGKTYEFSVKELKKIVPSGCKVCKDFTAVEADVSVGSVGSADGFSTIFVRSEIAKKVLNYIRDKRYAEFGEVNLSSVETLARLKEKRGL